MYTVRLNYKLTGMSWYESLSGQTDVAIEDVVKIVSDSGAVGSLQTKIVFSEGRYRYNFKAQKLRKTDSPLLSIDLVGGPKDSDKQNKDIILFIKSGLRKLFVKQQ